MIDILAFGSHPDDMEFDCGGILAAMAAAGKSITMVDLTLGDIGTNATPEIRKKQLLIIQPHITERSHRFKPREDWT